MRLRDGRGRECLLEFPLNELRISVDGETHVIPADRWERSIEVRPLGNRFVLSCDTGHEEINFLVDLSGVSEVARAMQGESRPGIAGLPFGGAALEGGLDAGGSTAAARPAEPRRATAVAQRGAGVPFDSSPAWPNMSSLAIVALVSSFLSFIPLWGIGFGFTIVTWWTAAIELRRVRPNAADSHRRFVARFSVMLSTLGAGVAFVALMASEQAAAGSSESWAFPEGVSLGAKIAAGLVILLGLSFHEAGHAIVAWWCGDDLARSMGRVTLNPIAHLDPFGSLLLPVVLLAAGLPPFGYARAVPVRPGFMRNHRLGHIWVSAAGPVSNLLQAAVYLAILMLLGSIVRLIPGAEAQWLSDFRYFTTMCAVKIVGMPGAEVLTAVALICKLGFSLNVLLAIFNLLPIPPLDGSWILENLFPNSIGKLLAMVRPFGFMLLAVLIFYAGDVFWNKLMLPYQYVEKAASDLLSTVTGF